MKHQRQLRVCACTHCEVYIFLRSHHILKPQSMSLNACFFKITSLMCHHQLHGCFFADSWLAPLVLYLFSLQNLNSAESCRRHSPLLPQSAQEMSSSGFLSRFCSLVPKQKLQMGMGSATGWQRDRADGKWGETRERRKGKGEKKKRVKTVSQLNSFIVQMKTNKVALCVPPQRMTAAVCIKTLTVNWMNATTTPLEHMWISEQRVLRWWRTREPLWLAALYNLCGVSR